MEKYFAFLRAVNVSGKNKISMPQLKQYLIEDGLQNVSTYLNSGNIIFQTQEQNLSVITNQIASVIKEKFSLDIQVLVLSVTQVKEIVDHAPSWWGKGTLYDNLIFLFPYTTFDTIYQKIGEPRQGLEQIENYKNAIFWSFDREKYTKTVWYSKTASEGINTLLTIRTANTINKLLKMSNE